MKPVKTFVILADDRQARFLVNEGVGMGLHQIGHLEGGDREEIAPGFAQRRGRGQAMGETARHAMEPRTSEEDLRREVFAAKVTGQAVALWVAVGYDRLVLAAPARMLAELRARLPGPMTDKITVALAKDLLHVALEDLPDHFEKVAAF